MENPDPVSRFGRPLLESVGGDTRSGWIRKSVLASLALCVVITSLLIDTERVSAQQLEPRAYSPSPVGLNFFGVGFLYSYGGVVLDPSLPIENVHAKVYNALPYYGRTFGLFGRQASVTLTTPYAWATVHGDVQDTSRSADRSGLADPQFRFAANLIGGPALTPQEFSRHKLETSLGASLTVSAPFGQYHPSKLINLGTNRWALKPELGLSQPFGKWSFELYAGVWLFTTNDDFYGGQTKKQDPLATYQAHVVYSVYPRLWTALDFTYYAGGGSSVDGQRQGDRQANTRGGMTVSVPIWKTQSLKMTWARGVSTRIGSSFNTVGLAWQWLWI
jgi:Putative MetA-pathway of phenol degradation